MSITNTTKVLYGHPCFGGNRHKNGRIHLAVAPRCTITCAYCDRKHDCANESRPGVASRISMHAIMNRTLPDTVMSDAKGMICLS